MDWGTGVTSLGTTTLKGSRVTFGIKDQDRLRHLCVLGRVGSGRGEFIAHMAFQDIARGLGVVILDAKGNVAPAMMERFDATLADRLIYIDPSEAEYPYTWNILNDIRRLPEAVQEERFVRVVESVFQVAPNPFAALLAPKMLARTDTTLVTFYRLLSEEAFRAEFFKDDEAGLKQLLGAFKDYENELADIEEKGRYIGKDTLVRNLLGQPSSKFSFTELSAGKIIIVNLEKIRMFPTRMTPIVRMFVEATLIAGEVATQPPALYLQDALRYLGDTEIERTFSSVMAALTVADTVIQESDRERREHALTRCGSIISFATHPLDRSLIERAFYPYVEPEEVEQLESGEIVVTLAIDAARTQPFFGTRLPFERSRSNSYQDLIIASRSRYTTPRIQVDGLFKGGDDTGRPKKPGGFQDAFKAMFEKRAGQGGSAAPAAVQPTDKSASTEKRQEKPEEKTAEAAPPQKSERPIELAEDVLRRMVYVRAVS